MPIGEDETHPYLVLGAVRQATRLILGSFPVYECTHPENHKKRLLREQRSSIPFFYGSGSSAFWELYAKHVDPNILPPYDPTVLQGNLVQHWTAMSDCIRSCQRIDYGAQDSELRGRSWNSAGIHQLINGGVRKILCTSLAPRNAS